MKTVLQIIGGMFLLFVLAGTVIPGVSCQLYFGTDQGVLEWHQKHARVKEGTP